MKTQQSDYDKHSMLWQSVWRHLSASSRDNDKTTLHQLLLIKVRIAAHRAGMDMRKLDHNHATCHNSGLIKPQPETQETVHSEKVFAGAPSNRWLSSQNT